MNEVCHFYCGDCIHWKLGKNGNNLPCKRIDHDSIKFATPWFCSYDGNQHNGVICADFEPASWNVTGVKSWRGFQEYWKDYVREWLPYGNTNTLIFFVLHGDTSIRYGVPMMDFVNGTMIEGDRLKAVEKEYYRKSKKSPIGYELIHEPIDGVNF